MLGTTFTRERDTDAARSSERAPSPASRALETVACPGCGGNQFQSVLNSVDVPEGIEESFGLVYCTTCQLGLTNPRLSIDSLSSLYPQGALSHRFQTRNRRRLRWLEHLALRTHFGYPSQPASATARLLTSVAMWKFHSRLRRRDWIPFRPKARLLDFGCGTAVFRERMRAFGWNVTEINGNARFESLHERLEMNGTNPVTSPNPVLTPGSFDVVTMWQVLQQSPNPRSLVREAAELLSPGGVLIIEVPNIESQTFAEFREHWFGLGIPRHLQHFSPKSLSSMIPLDLLRIVEIQQIGMLEWIKRSVQRAVAAGRTEYQTWFNRGKAFWNEKALHSEIANQADALKIIVERRS